MLPHLNGLQPQPRGPSRPGPLAASDLGTWPQAQRPHARHMWPVSSQHLWKSTARLLSTGRPGPIRNREDGAGPSSSCPRARWGAGRQDPATPPALWPPSPATCLSSTPVLLQAFAPAGGLPRPSQGCLLVSRLWLTCPSSEEKPCPAPKPEPPHPARPAASPDFILLGPLVCTCDHPMSVVVSAAHLPADR